MLSISSSASRRLLGAAAGVLALAGCASGPRPLPEDPSNELTAVPFFSQTDYQCGPAALATVLNYSGVPVTPAELVRDVYIPARKGSLQVELVAATRRHGRLPYPIDTASSALLAELSAGNPVLVLQDLGALGIRAWHYAVVVGYDPQRQLFVLRSGRQKRHLETRERFLKSWKRSDYWGLVATRPGVIPPTAVPETFIETLVDAANHLPPSDLDLSYNAAVLRWSDSAVVLFAAANYAAERGQVRQSEALYRRVLAVEPNNAAAHNNLANLLLDSGCAEAARQEAAAAMKAVSPTSSFAVAIQDTYRQAMALPATADSPACR